MDIQNGKMERI